MKRIGERLTFLAMLVMILVGLCSCNADLNRLLFGYVAEVRDSSGIHEFDSIQEGIDYIVQRNGASRDVESRASGDAEVIKEEDTVYLVRDVGEGEYGEFFKGKSITVNNYGGVIGIDFQDHVYRFENDTADGKFFNILDGSEVHIRGGHTIILASNPSDKYAMIVQSPNVKLTDHWLEDRRVVRSTRKDGENVVLTPKAVSVGSSGHLVIDGSKTKIGQVFEVASGGTLDIKGGTITMMEFNEPQLLKSSLNITGGTVIHPHKLDVKVQLCGGDLCQQKYEHVFEDFIYEGGEGTSAPDTVRIRCRYYNSTGVGCGFSGPSVKLTYDRSKKIIEDGQPKKPCYFVYSPDEASWEGIKPEIKYLNNVAEGTATGYAEFPCYKYEEQEISVPGVDEPVRVMKPVIDASGNPVIEKIVKAVVDFPIEKGNGYGGIDVKLPDDVDIGDTKKPTGKLSFDGQGVVSFVHEGIGSAATQYQWNIDNGKYFYPSAGYADCSSPDSVNSVNLVALEGAGIDAGISHKVVLHVKNKAGQTTLSMNVYKPEAKDGQLKWTIFRKKTVNNLVETDIQKVVFEPVIHSDDKDSEGKAITAAVNNYKWELDGVEMPLVPANLDTLNLPSLEAGRSIDEVPYMHCEGLTDEQRATFKRGSETEHEVVLTLTYWGGTRTCEYRFNYTVRDFTDR